MAAVPEIVVPLRFELVMPDCGECPAKATCAFSFAGGPTHLACEAHDPTRQASWLAMPVPTGFAYRNLALPMSVVSSGHLGAEFPA